MRHSGAQAKPANPESMIPAQGFWIPGLPLRGNPE
jgi:hypothetical protein